MEIWLVKNERIRLPITPYFEIQGSNNNSTEDLNEMGTVNLAGKPGLRTLSISSFFPSKEGPYLESSDVVLDPYYYYNKIYAWSRETEPIRLIITETPYNFEVLIDNFNGGETDGTGDVYYTLDLSEYIRLEATKYVPPEKELPPISRVSRHAARIDPMPQVFTVGKSDTPWTMAKKIYGNGELGKAMMAKLGLKKLRPGQVLDRKKLDMVGQQKNWQLRIT